MQPAQAPQEVAFRKAFTERTDNSQYKSAVKWLSWLDFHSLFLSYSPSLLLTRIFQLASFIQRQLEIFLVEIVCRLVAHLITIFPASATFLASL